MTSTDGMPEKKGTLLLADEESGVKNSLKKQTIDELVSQQHSQGELELTSVPGGVRLNSDIMNSSLANWW